MAELTASDIATIDPIVKRQAALVSARYGVESEDLAQEVWVWIVEESSPALLQYVRDAEGSKLIRAVYHAAVKWCEKDRKRKLRAQGLDWRDEYNYTRPEIARLLPLALDIGTVPGFTGRVLDDAPSAQSDPAHGGDLLVSLLDVRNAYSALSASDQRYLTVCVALNNDWDKIAPQFELITTSAYAKYMRILDRMVKRLGRKTDTDE